MLILLHEGFALVLTERLNVDEHRHSALQITLSLSDRLLSCGTPDGVVQGEAVLIPPLANHWFQESAGQVLVALFDDESVLSESVKEKKIQALDAKDFTEIRNYVRGRAGDVIDPQAIKEMLPRVGLLSRFLSSGVDERIRNLVETIKVDDLYTPSAEEAAQSCFLSESRFLHLFKEELGLPFRKYLQWIKLRRTMANLRAGRSLTEAAHAGGFSDSAHLSRIFTESFGMNPSEALKNSRILQAD